MEKTLVAELILPGSVTGLKFVVKLAVDQQWDGVDLLKAVLALPVDIAFLGMAFGVAILAHSQSPSQSGTAKAITVNEMVAFTVVGILIAILVTIFSKRSDRAFGANRTWPLIVWTLLSYTVSLIAAWGSLSAGNFM